MPHIAFPTELFTELIVWLPLETLLAGRSVSKLWRELINSAPLLPARRALLGLFLEIVLDSCYNQHKQLRLANDAAAGITSQRHQHYGFNRQEYIDHLYAQYNYIPDEFVLWILEWPEKVVIGRLGPTLPSTPRPTMVEVFDHFRKDHWGANVLGIHPPVVYAVSFDSEAIPGFPEGPVFPVLQVWRMSRQEKCVLVLADLPYFREHGEVLFLDQGFELGHPIELYSQVMSHPATRPRGWLEWLRIYFREHWYEMSGVKSSSYAQDVELAEATKRVQWKAMEAS